MDPCKRNKKSIKWDLFMKFTGMPYKFTGIPYKQINLVWNVSKTIEKELSEITVKTDKQYYSYDVQDELGLFPNIS